MSQEWLLNSFISHSCPTHTQTPLISNLETAWSIVVASLWVKIHGNGNEKFLIAHPRLWQTNGNGTHGNGDEKLVNYSGYRNNCVWLDIFVYGSCVNNRKWIFWFGYWRSLGIHSFVLPSISFPLPHSKVQSTVFYPSIARTIYCLRQWLQHLTWQYLSTSF